MLELRINGRVHALPVQIAAQTFSLQVGLRPGATGRFDIAPGGLLCRRRPTRRAGPAGLELGQQLAEIALGESELLPLERQFLLEDANPLPMTGHELLGHLHRLRIGNLRRQAPAPLGGFQLLALQAERALGGGQCVAHRPHGDLRLDQRGVQLCGTGPGVPGRGVIGQELFEPGPQPFEHGGIVQVTESPNARERPGGRQGRRRVTFSSMRPSSSAASWISLALLGLTACGGGRTGGACGITAIAGATLLLQEFGTPNQTLSEPPRTLPSHLVARIAAGPAFLAEVGRTPDSAWVVGVEGSAPERTKPGFGVLVLDTAGKARGVMIYESVPIRGAPVIGKLNIDSLMLPLLGIQLNPARFEDPRCPLFPDSLLR